MRRGPGSTLQCRHGGTRGAGRTRRDTPGPCAGDGLRSQPASGRPAGRGRPDRPDGRGGDGGRARRGARQHHRDARWAHLHQPPPVLPALAAGRGGAPVRRARALSPARRLSGQRRAPARRRARHRRRRARRGLDARQRHARAGHAQARRVGQPPGPARARHRPRPAPHPAGRLPERPRGRRHPRYDLRRRPGRRRQRGPAGGGPGHRPGAPRARGPPQRGAGRARSRHRRAAGACPPGGRPHHPPARGGQPDRPGRRRRVAVLRPDARRHAVPCAHGGPARPAARGRRARRTGGAVRHAADHGRHQHRQGREHLPGRSGAERARVISPDRTYRTLAEGPALSWLDAFSHGPDGYVYTVANQLHRSAPLNAGTDRSRPPFRILRFRPLAPGRVGR